MNKKLSELKQYNEMQFEGDIKKTKIDSEILEQYFVTLYKQNDKVLFEKYIELVKKYHEDFLIMPNNALWASVILSPTVDINWLISLGITPQKESKLVEYIFFRKFIYAKAWETSDETMDEVCQIVCNTLGEKNVIKQLENFVNTRLKTTGYVENKELDTVEKYYQQYQKKEDKLYSLRWNVLKKQIYSIEKTQGDITQTYAFQELIMPNIQKLVDFDKDFIVKIKSIKTKDNNFHNVVEKRILYGSLNQLEKEQLNVNHKESDKKIKI